MIRHLLFFVILILMSEFPPFEPCEYQNHHQYWVSVQQRDNIIPPDRVRFYMSQYQDGHGRTPELISKLKRWKELNKFVVDYRDQYFSHEERLLSMLSSPPTIAECANCCRSNYVGCSDIHKIKMRKLFSEELSKGKPRQFRHVKRKTGNQAVTYFICEQCYNHLQSPDRKVYNAYRNTWPAFIFQTLISREVRHMYGCKIWQLIPMEWRKWWILSLIKFPEYAELCVDKPSPIVRDDSIAYFKFTDGIDPIKNGKKGLSMLRDTVDKYLMPCVSCPYGCSEYLHKGNSIHIDGIFQRYLQKVRLRLNSSTKIERLIGLRNDFMRWDGDNDVWLFNPEWEVIPTIVFEDGCPMFRICRHHDCREGKHMLHTPRRPHHILPAPCSDQLAHCIMKPRTVKQMQKKYCSNSYQMFQQYANFTGIDACDLTGIGDYNINSLINVENECRAIMNRPDTNALLNTLVEKKIMSKDIVEMRRNYAKAATSQINFEPFYSAATYTPLQVCLDLHRRSNHHQYISVTDGENSVRVRNPFLPHIYPCMVADEFGVMPLIIPKLSLKASSPYASFRLFVWRLFSIVSQNEAIWRCLATVDSYNTSEWVGWLLLGIEKHSVSFRATPGLSKFHKKRIGKQEMLIESIGKCFQETSEHSLSFCFNGISGIEVFDYLNSSISSSGTGLQSFLSSIELAHDETKVVIIDNYFTGRSSLDIPLEIKRNISGNDVSFVLSYVSYFEWEGKEVSFMRHYGNGNHSKWWTQETGAIPIQVDTFHAHESDNVLVYTRLETPDTTKLNEEFLTYIGGQKKYCCGTHKLPLIESSRREMKCQVPDCTKTEHYCCPNLECTTYICKKCVESAPDDQVTFSPVAESVEVAETSDASLSNDNESVFHETGEDLYALDDSIGSDSIASDCSSVNSDLEEPSGNENFSEADPVLTGEALENFLTHDILPDEMDGINVGPSYTDEVTFLDEYMEHDILTTHAGEAAFHIASDQFGSFNVSGHVLLNQCGSLMTRSNHEVKGSSKHRNMLQSLCSIHTGSCIPLLQPEGTLFPSIFWRMQPQEHVILGAIPSAIMCEATSSFGFHGLPSHVRTRLTVPFACTSTDYRASVFYHDSLANLCATRNDTRLIVDRGLTVDDKSQLGLTVRGGQSSGKNALLGSIDSSQWVLNLCASQRYHPFDFFITLTCNQMKHFGVRIIKNWIDSESWTKYYPDYECLPRLEREEIRKALAQSASNLILRNWQEVCQLIILYLRTSPASPFKDVDSIFARNEYQKEVGNLSHIHLMLKCRPDVLSQLEREFVEDLICADLSSIIDSDRAMEHIESGLIERLDDLNEVYEDASKYLPHKCNLRCQRRVNDTTTVCKKDDIGKSTPDNTKAHFLPLPSVVPDELLPRLERLGIMSRDENDVITFSNEYFNPTRHIPKIHPPEDFNISPVEATLFILCRSMQNVQLIRGTGGCNKYVCKYIAKVDEQNYVVIATNANLRDKLKVTAEFLHNTKISSSAKAEKDLADKKYSKDAPKGRMISLNEMLHVMLKYPEVITDLQFTTIPTVPLEQRARLDLSAFDKISKQQQQVQDGAFVQPEIYTVRTNTINNQAWRQITPTELLILNDLRMSRLTVDRITQFSLRPPELREVFDNPGEYFRWFSVSQTAMESTELNKKITDDLDTTTFVDGFHRRVRLRIKAFDEVEAHLIEREEEGNLSAASRTVIEFFRRLIRVYNDSMLLEPEDDDFEDASDDIFLKHAIAELLETSTQDHLPIPVFSYTRPTQGHKFLLHVLLSMGRYHTENEITTHATLRDCFRAAKLIGPSNDPAKLQEYSDNLFYRFLEEQLFYFSNSRRVLFSWMVLIGDLFDSVIVHNEMLVTDMPSVQLSSLINSTLDELVEQKEKRKRNLIDAAFKELGDDITSRMPSKEEILNATKANPHEWDPVALFRKSSSQSETSFNEQKRAIEVAVHQIKKYKSLSNACRVTKNVGIRGFPGGGKTWCSLYVTMYAMSQGLDCMATAMMATRACSLGGIHWHKWLGLPSENSTPQRMAEKALLKLGRHPVWMDVIRNIDFILADELGQLTSEFVQAINIVLCKIRCNGNLFGGVFVLGTLDHTQIQPWNGRPFLSSPLIIPSFTMVKLTQSVRTQNASNYRIQEIARMRYDEINEDIINEFQTLCKENFTFVPSWEDAAITKSTFRLYSKKVPVAEATDIFIRKVLEECRTNNTLLRCKDSIDTVRYVGTHTNWRPADSEKVTQINSKTKIPPKLCFFKGAVFECTYNDTQKEEFTNTDPVLLYDVPLESDLESWKPIRVLKLPVGWKDFEFDMSQPKDYFLNLGFKEISIGLCPEYIIKLSMFTQAKRKQYGLRHRITGTIHGSMGDTYESLASEVSSSNPDYGLWDKGMLVVLLSRTRDPKKTIFVGSQVETIRTLTNVLRKRTMWTDYVEQILHLITVNEEDPLPALTPEAFPFRIADMSLPATNSGIVYMLNSLRDRSYSYIGKTRNPAVRLYNHNAGFGAAGTEPIHLRPFAVMAYIAGFDGDDSLMLSLERRWKLVRDNMINNHIIDPREWARAGTEVISHYESMTTEPLSLRLVLLFHDD